MKDRRKTFVLTAGREGGRWDVRQRVSFKGVLGSCMFWIEGRDPKIRDKDSHYFREHLGAFMNGKEIHHDWNAGAICYILEKKIHHKKHYHS